MTINIRHVVLFVVAERVVGNGDGGDSTATNMQYYLYVGTRMNYV